MPIFSSSKKGKYECRVILLDDNEQTHEITSKTLGDELLLAVYKRLDLKEKEYFGLKYKDYYGDAHWLDPNKSVKKQSYGQKSPFVFYFGVKFYAADPTRLREEITRYHFFLQVKKDILFGKIKCDESVAAELGAYAIQSELGDYNPSFHNEDFLSQFHFMPQQTEELEAMVADTYPKLKGLQPSDAEMKYLKCVTKLDMYGVNLNQVKGQDNMDYLLGLTPTGIVLFKGTGRIGSFIWPKITKLKYKGNCFLLRATQGKKNEKEEKEYTFICQNKDKSKALWKSCAEHHTFFRLEKANDVPASGYNFLFRKNSIKFRGRTQQDIERDADRRPRSQIEFTRTPSQRYKRRSLGSLSTSALNRDLINGPRSPLSQASTISAPWEASFTSQTSGLYSNGPKNTFSQRPRSVHTDYRVDVTDRGQSPKHSRRSGYSSAGENEQRKKRYYSGYTSTSDVESVRKNGTKYGSAPNIQHKIQHPQNNNTNHDPVYNGEMQQRHHRHSSRESLPNMQHYGVSSQHQQQYMQQNTYNPDQRRYRPSGSKSDGEDSSRKRHHHRHNRQSDSEMVAPLDVYHNTMGVALNNDEKKRQHRHNRRHQHSQQRHHRSSGNMPGYDPKQAEVLLELGPDSGSRDSSEPLSSTRNSDKENVHPQRQTSGHWNGVHPHNGIPAQQRYIQQYLPPHLLKQSRPPMTQVVNTSGGGGGQMYRPQYDQYFYRLPYNLPPPPAYNMVFPPPRHRLPPRSQSFNRIPNPRKRPMVTPTRSGSHKNLMSSSNYNITTEL